MELSVRFLEKQDLAAIVECERLALEKVDDDFQVPLCPPYMLGEKGFLKLIRQSSNSKKKAADFFSTRCRVVMEGELPVGACIIELKPHSYHIMAFVALPAIEDEVRKILLEDLVQRATKSNSRHLLSVNVPDGNYSSLKFFIDKGWSHKLVPRKTEYDTWYCEWTLPASGLMPRQKKGSSGPETGTPVPV